MAKPCSAWTGRGRKRSKDCFRVRGTIASVSVRKLERPAADAVLVHAGGRETNVLPDIAAKLALDVRVVSDRSLVGLEAVLARNLRHQIVLAVRGGDRRAIDHLIAALALDSGLGGERAAKHQKG